MDTITYTWFNPEKTVILCTYPDAQWTWNDFHQAFHVQKEMIESVDHPRVHVIVDTTNSHWMPKGGSILSGVGKLTDLKHPRQGHTIVVGAKGVLAAFAKIATKVMGENRQEMHLVSTMQDAEALLAKLMEQTRTS